MRVVRSLLAFLFIVVGAAFIALVLALYLAATGRSVAMLRAVAAGVGRTIAGQQTTDLSLAVQLQPDARRLSGRAQLTVRGAAGRQYLYFLLNDGLEVRAAWEEANDGTRTPLTPLRLWLLTVIELPHALAADEEVHIGLDYLGHPHALAGAASSFVWEGDDVVMAPADFWYPADLQGFFTASVEVALPADLTLVHNGNESSRTVEGTSARVRYATERPVPGLSLVAGRYEAHAAEHNDVHTRVLLPPGSQLDPERLLSSLATTEETFTSHYGPAGFSHVALFVDRRLARGFNDGNGLIGLPERCFADGEYGFGAIAHEVAHNWWGATVGAPWLLPDTGGEWIVEGFAEMSSWRALRESRGEAALLRAQSNSFFDPDHTLPLTSVTAIDNAFDGPARATIYGKGAFVAYMLEESLGDDRFDADAKQFLDQFRYRSATASDVETAFSTGSPQPLGPFFAAWVRGNESIDLALDPQEGGAAVRNHRTAPAPTALALWRFAPEGGEPDKQSSTVGATVPIGSAGRLVLDPLAAVADMFRSNNVLPRRDSARAVATSARGDLMLVSGEPYPWETATIEVVPHGGAKPQSWVIDNGLMADPVWSADGTRILAVEAGRDSAPTLLALNVTDGSRRPVSHDVAATGSADATIVARGGRLLRIANGKTAVLADYPAGTVVSPLAAPTGGAVAYAVRWGTESTELRVLPGDSAESRTIFTWPAGPLSWRWSPDGTRLFAALPGDWDWQLWELPLDGTPPRALVREAARIRDLAVAADGNRIAVVAQAEVDDALARSTIFLIDRRTSEPQHFDLGGWSAFSGAWLDDGSLVAVVADPTYPSLPVDTQVRTLHLADGSLSPYTP